MAIFSDTDINRAMKNGEINIDPLIKGVGPSSVDFHVKQLYKLKKDLVFEPWMLDEDMDVFLEKRCEKVPLKNNGSEDFWWINNGESYLATTIENVKMDENIMLDVDTRSSWARMGVRVQHVDDRLDVRRYEKFEGSIGLSIICHDKPVKLRPKDRICQGIFHDGMEFLTNKEILKALGDGKIKFYQTKEWYGEEVTLPKYEIDNHSLVLSLDPVIRKFIGSEIDPKKDLKGLYEKIDISNGYRIGFNNFFLGSSAETVYIGPEFVGMLREIYQSPYNVRTHSNAGYIDPGFEGTITLEQFIPGIDNKDTIYPYMKMGELEIHPLKTECTKPYKSKYSGQRGATVSKASEDYKH